MQHGYVCYKALLYFLLISTANDDYSATQSSSIVTIDSSTSRVDIAFPIVDDTFYELAENLFAVLSFAPGGGNSMVVLSPNRVQVNILDDDGMVEYFQAYTFQVTCAIIFRYHMSFLKLFY